jgi:hypothetical protein
VRRGGAWLAAALVAVGCAPRPLLERAIRARGGPLHGVVRASEAEVHAGFPGTWTFRTAFAPPDRYGWMIDTTGEPDFYLFDGTAVRTFVGGSPVAVDTSPRAALRSHARFTAVANLDALLLPGVRTAPLAAADVPAGATAGVAAVFADDGARFRLGFDAADRLVHVEGPLDLPPLGAGVVQARYADFRRVRRFVLPYRTTYALAGQVFADERALAICPDDARLDEEAFRTANRIPPCPPAREAP